MNQTSITPPAFTGKINSILAISLTLALPVWGQDVTTNEIELPQVNVTASREIEKATGPADGYVARRSATGTKSDTALIETPQSISVITQQQIEMQGIQGLEQTLSYVAGAGGGAFGFDSRSDWMLVRGFEPARFLDGLGLPNGVWTGDTRQEVYGLERMEVLKGPSSVVFGQMPPGGMVNMVSKRPSKEQIREISLSVGSYNQKQAAFDLGGALNEKGTLLYRLTGLARKSDTPLDFSRDDRYFIAPAITWAPSDDTSLTLLMRYQYANAKGVGGFLPSEGTLLFNPYGKIPQSRYTGEPNFDKYKKDYSSIGWAFDHRVNDTWTFRQNFRYAHSTVEQDLVGANGLDDDLRTLNRYTYTPWEQSNMLTLDNNLEGTFTTGALRHTLLTGLDYSRSNNTYQSGYGSAPSINIFRPVYGSTIVRPAIDFDQTQIQSQLGAYLQDQIRINNWIITMSGRYDWVNTDTKDNLIYKSTTQRDKKFSGRIGANYLFDNGISPYVSYSSSFQPTLGTDRHGGTFKATTGEQYEIGVKYQPNNFNGFFNIAAYDTTMHNTLTVDPEDPWKSIQQGKTRVRGLELEARAAITHNFSMIGSLAFTNTNVAKSNDALAINKRVAMVPKRQASIWGDYTFSNGSLSGLGFGAGLRYTSPVFGDLHNEWKVPSVTLVDVVARYEINDWLFQLNATNLLGKKYLATCDSKNWCYYGAPRTVSLTAKYRW